MRRGPRTVHGLTWTLGALVLACGPPGGEPSPAPSRRLPPADLCAGLVHHVSAHAHRRPGWVGVSVVGDPAGRLVLDQELLLANVDTGKVCRVGHHRSFAREGAWDYWAEPHVVISPTGTRLLFGSDWGNGATVDTYVVELPSYRAP